MHNPNKVLLFFYNIEKTKVSECATEVLSESSIPTSQIPTPMLWFLEELVRRLAAVSLVLITSFRLLIGPPGFRIMLPPCISLTVFLFNENPCFCFFKGGELKPAQVILIILFD